MLKIYEYKNCSTCQKALKFLDSKKNSYQKIPIRETPPTLAEIKKMLSFLNGDIKKLFNISGQDYRALDLKTKLPLMSEGQALELLSKNGNLIKRPFVITNNDGWVGFDEEAWNKKLK